MDQHCEEGMEVQAGEDAVAALGASYQIFDPAAYLQLHYGPRCWLDFDKKHLISWTLASFHRAFKEGDIGGERLVDIGSGPTLYQVMSGCEVFSKVLLTDFLEANRQELRRWLQDDKSYGFDWSPHLEYVCKLEGRSPSAWREKAARLREVVVDVVPVDVHLSLPVSTDVLPSEGADCLVSCYCLEAACLDLDTLTRAMRNIRNLLKPGGHALLTSGLGMSVYNVGPGVDFPMLKLTEADFLASLKESGFTLTWHDVYTLVPEELGPQDDMTSLIFAKVKKEYFVN